MNNKGTNWFKWIVLALVAWTVLSVLVMNGSRNAIDGATGSVWNQIATGAEKINTLQGQVKNAEGLAKDYIDKMTAARNDISAAQQTGNLEGALSALGQAQSAMVNLNALVESNPDIIQVTDLFTGLMDETAGVFNRVGYARDQLIAAQVSYNNGIIWLPGYLIFGGRQNVLGANSNPANPVGIQPMSGQ